MLHRKVGVLMGGMSSERSVSMATGEAVLGVLRERGYDAEPVFVDRDIDLVLRQAGIDVAYNALHGRYGEDGCVQGLLEMLGIPYTGSDVLSSALAMNKAKSKQLFRLANVPTAPGYVLRRDQSNVIMGTHADFGYPAVVKPAAEGSSVGVTVAKNEAEFYRACERAFCFDDEVLIERFIPGQEVSVAVLGGRALGAIEIETATGFYDYEAKYISGDNRYFVPPRLSPERYRGVLEHAQRAHEALGCSGATRVDFIVGATGNEYVLEVNTLPGMTPTSLLPKIAAAAGLEFGDLVEAVLAGARLSTVERGERDRRIAQRGYAGLERREAGAPEHH